jgi:hypothetical protein
VWRILLLLLLLVSAVAAVGDIINLVLVEQARPKFSTRVPKVN